MAATVSHEHAANYRLDVTDFGPIAKASVEMRPLTVFVGPSNTGKSYLAVLTYALHRCLAGDPFPLGGHHRLPDLWLGFPQPDDIRGWLQPSFSKQPADALAGLDERIRLAMEKAVGLEDDLVRELGRCFGTEDLGALARRRRSGGSFNIRLGVPPEDAEDSISYELAFEANGPTLTSNVPENQVAQVAGAVRRDFERTDSPHAIPNLLLQGLRPYVPDLLGAASYSAYYLPADRMGVMHSHQVVVGTLVQNATTAGLRPSTTVPMLSGVLADFLGQLIGMGAVPTQRKMRTGLDTPFEQNLLQGSVHLKRAANYPSFSYQPTDWKDELPLMRTSSMVSELAPVVLYLRYVVNAGDVLIIEEPEAHLHPAMQAALARELARLVRAGVRIVLTTHSEWLLEQIANLVKLSALPMNRRDGISGADVALEPHEVGAWLFKPSKRPKGSVVEEVTLNTETGMYPTDYDDVSMALYNESADIFNRLQANKEGAD